MHDRRLLTMLTLGALWLGGCGAASVPADGDDDRSAADADADAGTDADAGADADADAGADADETVDVEADAPGDIDPCVALCGNGRLDCREECDDGNTTPGDGCDAACLYEPPAECGDGTVNYALGEQCDDRNARDDDDCDTRCRIVPPPTCGNGTVDVRTGEWCDDGNDLAGDGCSPACRLEPFGGPLCGNTVTDLGERCDDGDRLNGDACNPTCNLTNTTTRVAGRPGISGATDGPDGTATFGNSTNGGGTLVVVGMSAYVADAGNNSVRKVDLASGSVITIAGSTSGTPGYIDDTHGTNARFSAPEAIATDGATLWVADGGNHVVRAVSLTPPYAVTTLSGSGVAGHQDGDAASAQYQDTRGLTYVRGQLYILDGTTHVLRRIDPADGHVVTLAGTPGATGYVDDCGPAARFGSPRYMAWDGGSNLLIADTNGNVIRTFNLATGCVGTLAGDGNCGYLDGSAGFLRVNRVRGMASDGSSLYWAEQNAHTIRQFVFATGEATTLVGALPTGCVVNCSCGSSPPPGSYAEGTGSVAELNTPFGMTYDLASGDLLFVDAGNRLVRRVH